MAAAVKAAAELSISIDQGQFLVGTLLLTERQVSSPLWMLVL